MADIVLKRNGTITLNGCDRVLGTYKYHKLGGRDKSGNKLIPYYYSVELINGEKFKIVYSRNDIREIVTNRWEVLNMSNKNFILRAGTAHVGYYFGTIEGMTEVLNGFGIEVTEVSDIPPQVDMGVTYNRIISTKMEVIGRDAKAQDAFLEEYNQLVEKYSCGRKKHAPQFSYGDVEWFFKGRPIETDAVSVLVADDTTFHSSRIDEETGGIISYLSQRDFEPCSALTEEYLWWYLTEFCYYERPESLADCD